MENEVVRFNNRPGEDRSDFERMALLRQLLSALQPHFSFPLIGYRSYRGFYIIERKKRKFLFWNYIEVKDSGSAPLTIEMEETDQGWSIQCALRDQRLIPQVHVIQHEIVLFATHLRPVAAATLINCVVPTNSNEPYLNPDLLDHPRSYEIQQVQNALRELYKEENTEKVDKAINEGEQVLESLLSRRRELRISDAQSVFQTVRENLDAENEINHLGLNHNT